MSRQANPRNSVTNEVGVKVPEGKISRTFFEEMVAQTVANLASATVKKGLSLLWDTLNNKISSSYAASDRYSPAVYTLLYRWADSQGMFSASSRHKSISGKYDYHLGEDVNIIEALDGTYWRSLSGCVVKVEKGLTSPGKEGDHYKTILIQVFGREGNPLDKELQGILDSVSHDNGLSRVYDLDNPWRVSRRDLRDLSSIVLPQDVLDRLIKHLDWWKSSKAMYASYGFTYKTSILLWGPPGTGKTSLAQAITKYLGYSLAVVRIDPSKMADLKNLISNAKPKTVLLMEDIDRAITAVPATPATPATHPPGDKPPVAPTDVTTTASATPTSPERAIPGIEHLMNALDGVTSPSEVVIIMSTNNRDKIDPALIRPGRVDMEIYLGLFDWDRAVTMASRFGVEPNVIASWGESVWSTPAELQLHLMQEVSRRSTGEAVGHG